MTSFILHHHLFYSSSIKAHFYWEVFGIVFVLFFNNHFFLLHFFFCNCCCDLFYLFFFWNKAVQDGRNSQDYEDFLPQRQVQEAHPSQGFTVQEGQGFRQCSGFVSFFPPLHQRSLLHSFERLLWMQLMLLCMMMILFLTFFFDD